MPADRTQQQVLLREYLPIRAKILEIAAALDRMDRAGQPLAEGAQEVDQTRAQLQQALAVLQQAEPSRAERVQQIFSLPYDAHWQEAFGMTCQC